MPWSGSTTASWARNSSEGTGDLRGEASVGLETLFLAPYPEPRFRVLKRELLNIPLFVGTYAKVGMIAVDRGWQRASA